MTGPVSTAVAQRTKTIGSLIEQMKPQIARALPKHMDADRLARIALTVVRQTPQLANASPESLLGALMTCAQLGLEPGPLGHAYLVPFRNSKTGTTEVQFIPGYRGLIDLARRSGQVRSIAARIVRQGDYFEYDFGLDERLEHTPKADPSATVTHAYAVVRYVDGGHDFEVMTTSEVNAIRDRSKAAKNGPWVTDWDEMAKKTVIRRLAKRMPMSIEFHRAVAQDENVRTTFDADDLDLVPEGVDTLTDEVLEGEVVSETVDEPAPDGA